MASNLDLLSDPYFIIRPLALVEADDWATQSGDLGEIIYYRTVDGWDEILDGEYACHYRLKPAEMLELDICDANECSADTVRTLLRLNSSLAKSAVDSASSYCVEGRDVVFRMPFVSKACTLQVVERDLIYVLTLIREGKRT